MATSSELQKLRSGNRLKYDRRIWQVHSFSTYTDPAGYKTSEWLIKVDPKAEKAANKTVNRAEKAFYLLREVDPEQSDKVNWYLSEEVQHPVIQRPPNAENCLPNILQLFQSKASPIQDLKAFYRNYFFESDSTGDYRENGIVSPRRTWDYWDATHQWNLAFEYWLTESKLMVYSTRTVSPEDFTDVDLSGQAQAQNLDENVVVGFLSDRDNVYLMISISVMVVGVLFLLSGI
jgi:hypothetical protein